MEAWGKRRNAEGWARNKKEFGKGKAYFFIIVMQLLLSTFCAGS